MVIKVGKKKLPDFRIQKAESRFQNATYSIKENI